MGAFEANPFRPIVVLQFRPEFSQRILNHPDEIGATGGQTTHALDRIAFGMIIRNDEHFAIGLIAMRRALNHLVGSLAGT